MKGKYKIVLLILLLFSTVSQSCADDYSRCLKEVKVNGEIFQEEDTVYIFPGDRIDFSLEIEKGVENYEIAVYYPEEDFREIKAPSYRSGSYEISLEAGSDIYDYSEVAFELEADGEIIDDFVVYFEVWDISTMEIEIVEPEEGNIYGEDETIYLVLDGGIEKEDFPDVYYVWNITRDGDRNFNKIVKGEETRVNLKDGMYFVNATAFYGSERQSSAHSFFVVENTIEGNNAFISYSQTPKNAIAGEPVKIDFSGSYADSNMNFFVDIPGSYSKSFPYNYGSRNKLWFEHTFPYPGVYKVTISARKFGETKNIAKETFTIEVAGSGESIQGGINPYDCATDSCRYGEAEGCYYGDGKYVVPAEESRVSREFAEAVASEGKVEVPPPSCGISGFLSLTAVGALLLTALTNKNKN